VLLACSPLLIGCCSTIEKPYGSTTAKGFYEDAQQRLNTRPDRPSCGRRPHPDA
jgi:hypothetical protein